MSDENLPDLETMSLAKKTQLLEGDRVRYNGAPCTIARSDHEVDMPGTPRAHASVDIVLEGESSSGKTVRLSHHDEGPLETAG